MHKQTHNLPYINTKRIAIKLKNVKTESDIYNHNIQITEEGIVIQIQTYTQLDKHAKINTHTSTKTYEWVNTQ